MGYPELSVMLQAGHGPEGCGLYGRRQWQEVHDLTSTVKTPAKRTP